ncbi:MAG: SxtJ family membrane protein [Candidatus Omnitrophica bacterium]|nr:SxtJ family membrane protein [Candidatus Omnitrophota bacterium]
MRPRTADQKLRSFGRTMAVCLVIVGIVLFLRRNPGSLPVWVTAVLFYATGMARPQWLSLPYDIWMKLAFALSWINSRILLCVIFYGIMAPAGLAMRLFRFDPLDRRIKKGQQSYWLARKQKAFTKKDYERLY